MATLRMLQAGLTLVFALLVFFISPAVAEAEPTETCPATLTIGWDPWPPYQYISEDGRLTGLDVGLVTAVLESAGCSVRFQKLPWKRALLHLRNGWLDAVMGASKTPERQKFGLFSAPYREEEMALMALADRPPQPPVNTLQELASSGLRLGLTLGYFYGQAFAELRRDPVFAQRLIAVETDAASFRMLRENRVDAILIDNRVALYLANQAPEGVRLEKQLLVHANPVHVLFSRKSVSPKLVAQFDSTLKKLRLSGDYDRIIEGRLPPAKEPD